MSNSAARRISDEERMGIDSPASLIARFAMPAIFSMVVSSMYNIIDKIFVGNGIGYLGLSATTSSSSVMTAISSVGAFVGTGASIYLAMELGKKNHEKANDIITTAFLLEVILGIVIMAAGSLALSPICRITGAGDASLPYARQYLRVIFLGSVMNCVGAGLIPVVRAQGKPRDALFLAASGSVINMILDPVFIFVLKLGMTGAALATVIAQTVSAILVTIYLFRGNPAMGLSFCGYQIGRETLVSILKLGFPAFLMSTLQVAMVVIFTYSLRYYGNLSEIGGDAAMSSLGLAISIGDLIIMIGMGMQQGMSPLISYNYGAKHYDRVKKILILGFCELLTILVVFWIFMEACPALLISIFGVPSNLEFAVYSVRVYNLTIPLLGIQLLGSMYLQATGQVKRAMIVAMTRNVLFGIPLLLVLPLFFGVKGLMLMGPFADAGGAIMAALLTGGLLFKMPGQRDKNTAYMA